MILRFWYCLPRLSWKKGNQTGVTRSTQPFTLCLTVKWVSAFGVSNNKMAMADVDGSSLLVESQPKSFGLVWGLTAVWHWVCIHQVNRVNSRNGSEPWWQHHKYCHIYYYYYYHRHYYYLSMTDALICIDERCATCKVDYATMKMFKPYKTVIRRSFQHGLWVRYRMSAHQTQLHFKVHQLQVWLTVFILHHVMEVWRQCR